jgi:hypothetical protein
MRNERQVTQLNISEFLTYHPAFLLIYRGLRVTQESDSGHQGTYVRGTMKVREEIIEVHKAV